MTEPYGGYPGPKSEPTELPGNFPAYIYEEVKKQSLDCRPNECVGFVVQYRHFVRAVGVPNVHECPERFAKVHPAKFAEIEDKYEKIHAMYHSHVNSPATLPGKPLMDHDRAVSERFNLPFLVYSLLTQQFSYYAPSGWVPDLIGRRWVSGVFDCFTLCRDYYETRLKIKVGSYEYDEFWYEDPKRRLLEDNFRAEGFVPIHASGMKKHDVILFSYGTPQAAHCAIYLGDGMMLHQRSKAYSAREILSQYHRDHMVVVLRHHTLLKPEEEGYVLRDYGTESNPV